MNLTLCSHTSCDPMVHSCCTIQRFYWWQSQKSVVCSNSSMQPWRVIVPLQDLGVVQMTGGDYWEKGEIKVHA